MDAGPPPDPSRLELLADEAGIGPLHQFKRLLVRYDRRHEFHEAFLALACCLVCFRRLQNSF